MARWDMQKYFDITLRGSIEANVNAAVRRVAVVIGNEIHEAYNTAINNFYSDYSPRIYDRTGALKDQGAKGVGGRDKNYKQLFKGCYEAGITVGPENYEGNPYEKPYPHGLEMNPSIVFPMAFERGIHGFTKVTVSRYNKDKSKGNGYWFVRKKSRPKKSSSPKKEVRAKFEEITDSDRVIGMIKKELGL